MHQDIIKNTQIFSVQNKIVFKKMNLNYHQYRRDNRLDGLKS